MKELIKSFSLISKLLIIFCAISEQVNAQGNSPFSQFGIGDIYNSNFQTNFSRGGTGASITSRNTINPLNPATYSQFTLTTGEAGIYSSQNYFNLDGVKSSQNNTNISAFALGFPLLEKMGLAFGLTPYSSQNYSTSYADTLSDGSEVNYIYEGEGNLTKAFLGFGMEKKGLSLGVSGHFIFGRLNDINKVKYSSSDYQNIQFQNFSEVRDFGISFGGQYKLEIAPKKYARFGVFYELGSKYSTKNYTKANYFSVGDATTSNNKVVEAEFHDYSEYVINTEDNPEKDFIQLPSHLQSGISIGKENHWELSLEYRLKELTSLRTNGLNSGFNNAHNVLIGGKIVPNSKALGRENYWKTVTYNFGSNIGTAGITVDGATLLQYGMNFGFGLPLKKFKYQTTTFGSSIYLSLGYLRRINSDLKISEDFLNLNIGVVLNDKWFIKRKFD